MEQRHVNYMVYHGVMKILWGQKWYVRLWHWLVMAKDGER